MEIERMITRIGDKFSYKFPLLRDFLKPLYHVLFYNRYNARRDKAFHKAAYEVLSLFDKCLTESNIKYSLAYGSMLGAVREKGIIGHDSDLDTLIWADEYDYMQVRNSLLKYGFKLTRCLVVNGGSLGREETYELHSVPIDIFYIYPPINKLPYTCSFIPKEGYPTMKISMEETGEIQARRGERPFGREMKRVPFGELSLPIMKNAHEILESCYGKNYMIPDPTWKSDATVIVWNDVKATIESML